MYICSTYTYINIYYICVVCNTIFYLLKTMAGQNGDSPNLLLPDIPLHVLEMIILSDN